MEQQVKNFSTEQECQLRPLTADATVAAAAGRTCQDGKVFNLVYDEGVAQSGELEKKKKNTARFMIWGNWEKSTFGFYED